MLIVQIMRVERATFFLNYWRPWQLLMDFLWTILLLMDYFMLAMTFKFLCGYAYAWSLGQPGWPHSYPSPRVHIFVFPPMRYQNWTVWPIAFLYHVLNWIINDAVSVLDFLLPASSLRSLTLGKPNCHVMKVLRFPRERPTWQGTEVSVQKPAKNWDLTAVTGMSLAVNSSVSVKPWDNCFPANSLPENS